MNLPVIVIVLIALGLSLSAGQNESQNDELEKQIASLKIRLDRQDVELQELKGITNVQNKQISILNNSCELNEDLWQMLQNQSAIIVDLQNQQEQLENLTHLLQSKTDMTEHDDSVLEQEIYRTFYQSREEN